MRKLLFFAAAAVMMASCSKDMTEDVTTAPVVGKSTILATYGGNDGTRSVADWNAEKEKFVFTWESGDALGVFDAVDGDKTNAYFGYSAASDGEAAKFTGSKDLLFAKNYVAYYPYDKNNTGIDAGKLTLNIPATQSYRAHDVYGSFAQNLAPAVSYGAATEDDYIDMTFLSLASYVRVPIVGSGTITSLELSVTDAGLAGDFTVALSDIEKAKKSADIEVTPTTGFKGSIKLVCGKKVNDVEKGVELKDTPTYFWFVIPGDVNFKGKTVTITINDSDEVLTRVYGADEAGVLPVNQSLAIGVEKAEDGSQVPFEWIQGAKDAVKISTAEQFVKYAYLATCGKVDKDGVALTEEVAKLAAEFYNESDELRPAIFMNDIDMAELKISNEHSDYVGGANGKEAKYNAFEEAVYYWWYHSKNNDAISTIGNYETEYSIDGRGFSLIGLKVNGNGLFCDGYDSSTKYANATVKDLVLDGVTVNAGEGKNVFGERKTAWFLTNRHYNGGTKKYGITLTNVTVNDNCVLNAAEGVNKVLTGRTFTDDLNEDDKYVVNNTDLTYADQLCVMDDVTLADYENLYNYAAIHTTNGKSKIVTVADEAEARALIHDAVYVNANTITTTNDKVWYSVMDVKGTSYWTGKTADAERKDEVFTAEELAFFVKNGKDVTLTNNIDLGYGGNRGTSGLTVTGFANSKEDVAWVTSETAINVEGAGKTISRATVTTGLFGAEATVNDLKVSSVFVNGAYLLAKTGTATKVTASGLNYKNAKAVNGVLAGLFYEADIETAAETTDCTVTLNKTAAVAEHDYFGYIYGVIGVDLGQTYELKAAGDAYGVFSCYANADDDHEGHTGITRIVFSNYTTRDELPRAKELVKWDTSKGEISDKHTVYFLTPAESDLPEAKLDTDNYLIYDGTLTDGESVKKALTNGGSADLGDNISVDYLTVSGGTLNGNGKTITTTGDNNSNHGLTVNKGTVKDVVTNGAFYSIYGQITENETVTLENVTTGGGDSGYGINFSGAGNLVVNGGELIGWSSWNVGSAIFSGVTFSQGEKNHKNGYDEFYDRVVAVHMNTTFKNCIFGEKWCFVCGASEHDGPRIEDGEHIYLINCKCYVNGVLTDVTADNFEKVFEKIDVTEGMKASDIFKFELPTE